MSIQFKCSGCDTTLTVPDATAGQMARCPSCSKVVRVPAPDAPAEPSEEGVMEPEKRPPRRPRSEEETPRRRDRDDDDDRPRRRGRDDDDDRSRRRERDDDDRGRRRMIRCPECDEENDADERRCVRCGYSLRRRDRDGGDDAISTLIPYKNALALWSYYMGVFSIACCLPLALAAIVTGFMGLSYAKRHPQAKGEVHAWVGIILGGLVTLAYIAGLVIFIVAAASNKR